VYTKAAGIWLDFAMTTPGLFKEFWCDDSKPEALKKSMVLRNLTTHEYVNISDIYHVGFRRTMRQIAPFDVLSPFKRNVHIIEETNEVGPMEILLSNICFSNEPDISIDLQGEQDVHQGPWAGHRLDYLSRTEFERNLARNECDICSELSESPCPGWKNMGGVVRDKIKHIWDCSGCDEKFGPYQHKP